MKSERRGVYEKLVEHWLTNVNELGYQIPFCEALLAHGYTILHVSRHGKTKCSVANISCTNASALRLKAVSMDQWRTPRECGSRACRHTVPLLASRKGPSARIRQARSRREGTVPRSHIHRAFGSRHAR